MYQTQKAMKILTSVVFSAEFVNSSPSCAYELMRHYLQWNLLNEVYLLSKFDDSSFSVTENIQI